MIKAFATCTAFWRTRGKRTGIREQGLVGSDLVSDALIRLVVAHAIFAHFEIRDQSSSATRQLCRIINHLFTLGSEVVEVFRLRGLHSSGSSQYEV
jgi:hypothetical protein